MPGYIEGGEGESKVKEKSIINESKLNWKSQEGLIYSDIMKDKKGL